MVKAQLGCSKAGWLRPFEWVVAENRLEGSEAGTMSGWEVVPWPSDGEGVTCITGWVVGAVEMGCVVATCLGGSEAGTTSH